MRCWNYKDEKTIVEDLFNHDCKIQMFTLIKASDKKASDKKASEESRQKSGEKKWRNKSGEKCNKKTQENKIVKTVDFMRVLAYNKLN